MYCGVQYFKKNKKTIMIFKNKIGLNELVSGGGEGERGIMTCKFPLMLRFDRLILGILNY